MTKLVLSLSLSIFPLYLNLIFDIPLFPLWKEVFSRVNHICMALGPSVKLWVHKACTDDGRVSLRDGRRFRRVWRRSRSGRGENRARGWGWGVVGLSPNHFRDDDLFNREQFWSLRRHSERSAVAPSEGKWNECYSYFDHNKNYYYNNNSHISSYKSGEKVPARL